MTPEQPKQTETVEYVSSRTAASRRKHRNNNRVALPPKGEPPCVPVRRAVSRFEISSRHPDWSGQGKCCRAPDRSRQLSRSTEEKRRRCCHECHDCHANRHARPVRSERPRWRVTGGGPYRAPLSLSAGLSPSLVLVTAVASIIRRTLRFWPAGERMFRSTPPPFGGQNRRAPDKKRLTWTTFS